MCTCNLLLLNLHRLQSTSTPRIGKMITQARSNKRDGQNNHCRNQYSYIRLRQSAQGISLSDTENRLAKSNSCDL